MAIKKLYCYVDETGQDTKGELFIVSIVVAKEDREELRKLLEKIEEETGKKKTKWIQTKKQYKITYLDRVLNTRAFRNKIFYSLSEDTKAYKEVTLITIASAITIVKENDRYKASVFIDGLQKKEIPRVGAGLRKIGVHTEKVRGIRDENDALIRLVDSISGLVREWYKGIDYAQKLFKTGAANKTLREI